MFGREPSDLLPPPGAELEGLLAQIPVRNPATRVVRESAEGWLMEWDPGDRAPLRFQLDPLGSELLKAMDGRRSIVTFVESFAATYRLGFLEASALWVAYTRMLAERHLIYLQTPGAHENADADLV